MKRSSRHRILTTHAGSLPRPDGLVQLMYRKEEGEAIDAQQLGVQVGAAVEEIVKRQAEAGIDIVNDGEASKPSYATYVKDRLNGFGGESQRLAYRDLVDFPELNRRVFDDPGRSRRKTPACDGPISVRDPAAVRRDIARLQSALALAPAAGEGFMTAASPGVISLFFKNTYYATHEAYLAAIAAAMRHEYQAITGAGLVLQVDCPDLAMGRHIQFPDATLDQFRRTAELHVEALNHALQGIDPEQVRIHLCWGNYEGPHHYDVPLKHIIDIAFKARASGISYEAANPRHAHEWQLFRDVRLPAGKVLLPGVVDSTTNYIEHPALVAERLKNLAGIVGAENIIASTDCGFGTWVGMNKVDPGVVWAKFQSIAEGAQLAV